MEVTAKLLEPIERREDGKFKNIKVRVLGEKLIELTPKGLRGVYYCIEVLPEIQKGLDISSVFIYQDSLFIILL